MAESARDVIVLVESDKIGRRIPNLELPWHKVTTLITDNNLDDATRQAIEAKSVTVICAEVNE
jgi:DeoR/GlpR family transcriptional regulator of sugar metabolism